MTWYGATKKAAGSNVLAAGGLLSTRYYCMICGSSCIASGWIPECLNCGNQKKADLVPIHVDYDSLADDFYCACDWHGG